MKIHLVGAALLMSAIAACAGAEEEAPVVDGAAVEEVAVAPEATTAVQCQPMADNMPVAGRVSPYDSVAIDLGGQQAKLCYGRPSMNDREIFGGLLPYDTLWRTGANEPTTIHLPVAARIAGMDVEPGAYSIYTVPGEEQWTVIVNRSVSQWGIESAYSESVRAQEVGRAQVPAETIPEPVETFTIQSESTGANSADLVLEWENTRVRIPIERA